MSPDAKGALTADDIGLLLGPYLPTPTPLLLDRLAAYLQLLLKWNAKTNLTAIRDPAEIVRRHFGESLVAAQHVGPVATLLDFGSGAGFPGLPIALYRPDIAVALAESQHKKSSFLQEAARALAVETEIWPRRVEEMASARRFDCVTLRAVDRMGPALRAANHRAEKRLVVLTTTSHLNELHALPHLEEASRIPLPHSEDRIVVCLTRSHVPRGT